MDKRRRLKPQVAQRERERLEARRAEAERLGIAQEEAETKMRFERAKAQMRYARRVEATRKPAPPNKLRHQGIPTSTGRSYNFLIQAAAEQVQPDDDRFTPAGTLLSDPAQLPSMEGC